MLKRSKLQICSFIKCNFFRFLSKGYEKSTINYPDIQCVQSNTSLSNVKLYKKRNRRPLRKKINEVNTSFSMLSCNSASLKNKLFSLSKTIEDLNLSLFCVQETHFVKEGSVKFKGVDRFQIFEKLRDTKSGGGLCIGALQDLNPIWVGESMSIKITVQDMEIRVVNSYGPQEYDSSEKKENFWSHLDHEVFLANNEGNGLIIAMDSNSWLGPKILRNDPHTQNKNGELFANFLMRNSNLTILNAESLCKGLITRSRKVNGVTEKSVLDYVIVCEKVRPFVTQFTIDEEKMYALSNYSSRGKVKHSDHNSIITDMTFKFQRMKPDRRVIFDYNNQEGMAKFKYLTSIKGKFTGIFHDRSLSFKNQLRIWKKTIESGS